MSPTHAKRARLRRVGGLHGPRSEGGDEGMKDEK